MNSRLNRWSIREAAKLAALILALPFSASASFIPQSPPNILSAFIDVTYNASTDSFSATGFAFEFDDDGVAPNLAIAGGTFDVNATIDDSGILGGGAITIGGIVALLGFNSGILLNGTLTDLQIPIPTGDPLVFLFDVTGGDAAGLYGPDGGIILTSTGFPGSFISNFDNRIAGIPGTGSGLADVTGVASAVPEPTTLALVGLALAGLGFARRRAH